VGGEHAGFRKFVFLLDSRGDGIDAGLVAKLSAAKRCLPAAFSGGARVIFDTM
jgi:hypothetical protein